MRPKPATVIAFVALFTALGGWAQAADLLDGSKIKTGTVGTKQVRDRSLGVTDLSLAARASLHAIPDASIAGAKLEEGTITSRELAPGTIPSYTPTDPTRFSGTVTISFPTVQVTGCQSKTSATLTPKTAGDSLLDDVIVITPPASFPDGLVVTARPASESTIRVTVCNPGVDSPRSPGNVTFRYASFAT
jgi:hypothetical protein